MFIPSNRDSFFFSRSLIILAVDNNFALTQFVEIPSPTSAANEQPRNISTQQDDFEKEAYFGNSVHYDSDLPDFRKSTMM